MRNLASEHGERRVTMRVRGKLASILVMVALCIVSLGTKTVDAASTIPVYIFAGQSNMVGTATKSADLATINPDLQLPPARVLFWGPNTDAPRRWTSLAPPTEISQSMYSSSFGPEISAARDLASLHPKERIGILKYAWNGTSLYWNWDPNRSSGLYRGLIDRTRFALARMESETGRRGRIAGFFWMQGESDGNTYKHAKAYGKNLTEFIAAVRRDFKAPELPVIVGQIQDVRKQYPTALRHSYIVRQEQLEVALADPRVFLVSTDKLPRATLSPIHFNSKGTVNLGYRLVQRGFGL